MGKVLSHKRFTELLTAAPQDVSLPILKRLASQGYKMTRWATSSGAKDAECIAKDGDVLPLADFISGLSHAAPFYEERGGKGTHIGCHCTVVVSGPGKKDVIVSAFGIQK